MTTQEIKSKTRRCKCHGVDPVVCAEVKKGTPFSIECEHCDAGQDVGDLQSAIDDGWTRIEFNGGAFGGCYFTGLCPDFCDASGGCFPGGQLELF